MNSDEIKNDIKDQLAKINHSFTKVGRLGVKDPLKEDIVSLEKSLKKMKVIFRISLIGAILLSCIVFVVTFLKVFELLDSVDLNKAKLVILFALILLLNTLGYYKVKVNLENKIYLLNLLNKIDRL